MNRHFSSGQGRFMQVDPLGMGAVSLGDPQSLNLYAYVGNDPVNMIDPSGLQMSNADMHELLDPTGSGGFGGSGCSIDGAQASCSTAGNFARTGIGFNVPQGARVKLTSADGKNTVTVPFADFYKNVRRNPDAYYTGSMSGSIYYYVGDGKEQVRVLDGYYEIIGSLGNGMDGYIYGTGGMIDQMTRAKPVVAVMGAVSASIVLTAVILEVAGSTAVIKLDIGAIINPKIYAQLEKQFLQAGSNSIFKALRTAEKTLQEHIGKLPTLQYKSQVEGTIRNVQKQIDTIVQFIKDKGL